jgi:tRNA threonylcarbamoyl adenosine modification protein (Sua5/YciO/YrdC/YwlC family)
MKALYIAVHPSHPQPRVLAQAAALVARGGVIVCPTDACYSLVCRVGDKAAEDRMRAIRHIERLHHFTLLCRNVSEAATYAKISNDAFRLLKLLTPGPYTFILPATRETPRRLLDAKRKTVGLRIPAHPFVQGLLENLAEPLLSSTLKNDELDLPYADPQDIARDVGHAVDAVIDAGAVGIDMTTIIDLTAGAPRLVRQGRGDVSHVAELQ